MIFLNLPVKDLRSSRAFFTELGFEFHAEFSDDKAACMVVDQNIYVMLLMEERFRDFINGEISDATTATEVLTCLSVESRKQVDDLVIVQVGEERFAVRGAVQSRGRADRRDRAQPGEEARSGWDAAHVAGDRFHDDGGDFRALILEQGPHGFQIIVFGE